MVFEKILLPLNGVSKIYSNLFHNIVAILGREGKRLKSKIWDLNVTRKKFVNSEINSHPQY